jgi:hypothetical protein
MNILSVSDPRIIAQILVEAYKEMPLDEFLKTLTDIQTRGEQFARSEDSAFSSQLSEEDAIAYAHCCRSFHDNLQELKTFPRNKVAMYTLARTIAWWQTVSTFRTLHEKGPLEKV